MNNKIKPFNHAFTFRKGKISEDLLALTLKIIVWLCSSACKPGRTNQLLKVLGTISESLIKLSKDRGVRGLILYLKDIRLAYYLYLSGEFPLKKVKGVKVHPSGYPIILKPFIQWQESLQSSDPGVLAPGIRLLMTLLHCTRALSKGTTPNVKPITDLPYVDLGSIQHSQFSF